MPTNEEMRANAEARFKKNQDKAAAGRVAMAEYTAAAEKQSQKIERLRALRLERDAATAAAAPPARQSQPSRQKRFSTQ